MPETGWMLDPGVPLEPGSVRTWLQRRFNGCLEVSQVADGRSRRRARVGAEQRLLARVPSPRTGLTLDLDVGNAGLSVRLLHPRMTWPLMTRVQEPLEPESVVSRSPRVASTAGNEQRLDRNDGPAEGSRRPETLVRKPRKPEPGDEEWSLDPRMASRLR